MSFTDAQLATFLSDAFNKASFIGERVDLAEAIVALPAGSATTEQLKKIDDALTKDLAYPRAGSDLQARIAVTLSTLHRHQEVANMFEGKR